MINNPQQEQKGNKQIRLVDMYVHNRLDEVIVSRKATHEEINMRTKQLAAKRLRS